MKTKSLRIALAGVAVMSLIAGACGGSDGAATQDTATAETAAPAAECVTPTPVKLQLQWFTQAQFAGYYAAQDQGFYTEQCLDVTILEGAVDISPQTVLANGEADFAISWVSKALASREGSFDCASPFLATANGQVYYENVFEHDSKWSYRMGPSADDKKYATDTRKWSTGVVADGIYPCWQDSPISDLLTMKDICIYKAGTIKSGVTLTEENFKDPALYDVLPDVNKNGKWGKTSWDSFSYALLMGHNVWMHLTAVQEANRRFDAGEYPAMMRRSVGDYAKFEDIIEAIFSAPDRQTAEEIIKFYSSYWMEIVGTRGFKGKKTMNARTQFNVLYTFEEPKVDNDPEDQLQLEALQLLESEQIK